MWWRDRAQYIRDTLHPCEPTRDDIEFLIKYLPNNPRARDQMLMDYRHIWIEAAKKEPVRHKRQNSGRFAANNWLRIAKLRDNPI